MRKTTMGSMRQSCYFSNLHHLIHEAKHAAAITRMHTSIAVTGLIMMIDAEEQVGRKMEALTVARKMIKQIPYKMKEIAGTTTAKPSTN